MNQQTRNLARRFRPLAAAALLCASFGSQAADSGLGPWIAAQGNAALREIGQDLRDGLRQQLRPLLPQPTEIADQPAGVSCEDPAMLAAEDLREHTS